MKAIQKGSPLRKSQIITPKEKELEFKKNEIDQLVLGPPLQNYYAFVKCMRKFFKGLVEGKTIKELGIDVEELTAHTSEAEKEIELAENKNKDYWEQKLEYYQALYLHTKPRIKEFQQKLSEARQQLEEKAEQDRIKLVADLALQKEQEKLKNLKALEFFDIEKKLLAGEKKNEVEELIQRENEGKNIAIKDIQDLLLKRNNLRNVLNEMQSKNTFSLNNDQIELFDTLVNMIAKINQTFIHAHNPPANFQVTAWGRKSHQSMQGISNNALKALAF
ncbi:MAG: hypothetical protein HWD61_14910 [Parachlamydiaceae bacterium]|nr:MAG: hypothetical protein HWD61_14910 [Parachlamydiaceae bacterium]